MKSLSDLRAEKPKGRPERTVRVCLKPELVARIERLTGELADLPVPPQPKPNGKMAAPDLTAEQHAESERIESEDRRIRAELDSALVEMSDYEGEITVRASLTDGEWRQWVDANPARPKGEEAEHARDQKIAFGACDADELLEALGRFAYAWNGEPMAAEDWTTVFEPAVARGDKIEMARAVVLMYENRLDFRQWRSVLSTGLRNSAASDSPETSESPRSDSTGGSPAVSSEATTQKDSPAP